MEWVHPFPNEHGWILQFEADLVKGASGIHSVIYHSLTSKPQLLIIWRFFRLWALADTIQTPENMTRCMSDNYSAIEFWRSWHRSFNRWLVRYIYIPLGGAKYYVWNIWPTFTFVAVWHDIELKLLTWGWLVSGFILPEVVLRRVFGTAEVGFC